MPYTHEWLVEDRVLYSRVLEPYTDDEVAASSAVVVEKLSKVSDPVYFVINTLDLKTYPHKVMQTASNVQKFLTHPKLRQLIVVSDNSAVRFLALLATQIQRSKIIMHASVDDAFAYIVKQAPEIVDQMQKPKLSD